MADPRPCTPRYCGYGTGHACKTVFPDEFPNDEPTVWARTRDNRWGFYR